MSYFSALFTFLLQKVNELGNEVLADLWRILWINSAAEKKLDVINPHLAPLISKILHGIDFFPPSNH